MPAMPPFPIPAVPPSPALPDVPAPPAPPTDAPPDGTAPSAPSPASPPETFFDRPPQLTEMTNDASRPNAAARRHDRLRTTGVGGFPDGNITIPPRIECDF